MTQVPANPILDERVQARRQRDMNGFTEKHQQLVDKRLAEYEEELKETWSSIGDGYDNKIRQLYEKQAVNGKLPKGDQYDLERTLLLREQTRTLTGVHTELTDSMTKRLMGQYAESYYITAFGTEQASKVGLKVPILTESQVMGVVANPWLPDGVNYSARLRGNTAQFAMKMQGIVTTAVAEGLSVHDTARLIQEKTGESYNNAVRLARTELTRAAAQGKNQLFLENADVMDGKRWVATLDKSTAPKDAANDGKLYPLDYDTPENPGKPGERIPNHPNCRCDWAPVLSALGVNKGQRVAKEATGERTYTKARNYEDYAKEKGLPSLKERLDKDRGTGYLRKGETLEDYAAAVGMSEKAFLETINGAVFKAQLEEVVEDVVVAAAAGAFVPAKTVQEAADWAAVNIPEVAKIDYTDYDLGLANEVNEHLRKLYDDYPEIQGINYVGTAQGRNDGWYNKKVEELFEKNKDRLRKQGWKDKEILKAVKDKISKPRVPGNVMGQAANTSWGEFAGITFNRIFAKDYKKLSRATRDSVADKFHPEGTEAPISVLIHEFGHSIDYFLKDVGLREKYITPITKDVLKMSRREIREQLSEYAGTNDMEVIAEAFAEYRLNPNPRPIAKRVGEAFEAALEEYRRSQK